MPQRKTSLKICFTWLLTFYVLAESLTSRGINKIVSLVSFIQSHLIIFRSGHFSVILTKMQ